MRGWRYNLSTYVCKVYWMDCLTWRMLNECCVVCCCDCQCDCPYQLNELVSYMEWSSELLNISDNQINRWYDTIQRVQTTTCCHCIECIHVVAWLIFYTSIHHARASTSNGFDQTINNHTQTTANKYNQFMYYNNALYTSTIQLHMCYIWFACIYYIIISIHLHA